MTAKPYISHTRLASTATAQGCVVSYKDGKTVIEGTELTFFLSPEDGVTDPDGKTYSPEEAFNALGLKA